MNIYNLLVEDHNKAKHLYQEMLKASNTEQEELFEKLKTEILQHAQAEEEVFYKTLQKDDSIEGQIEHSYSEHEEVEHLLEDITDKMSAGEKWLDTAKELMQNLSHHIDEEENKLFLKAKKIIPKEQEEELGKKFQEYKKNNAEPRKKGKQGFASMPKDKVREIAAKGGRHSHDHTPSRS